MIINTAHIEYTLKKYTAYKLANAIGGVSRQNLNYYRSGKYSISKMTIELASKIQNYYNEEMNEMDRNIFEINREDNIVTVKFIEDGKVGTYKQDLDKNGVDIKRVLRPTAKDTEDSLKRNVTFDDGQAPEGITFLTHDQATRQLEKILR